MKAPVHGTIFRACKPSRCYVLRHAEVPALWGGYVGVDVFFVLSGFLITGILLSGACKNGSV